MSYDVCRCALFFVRCVLFVLCCCVMPLRVYVCWLLYFVACCWWLVAYVGSLLLVVCCLMLLAVACDVYCSLFVHVCVCGLLWIVCHLVL